MQRTSILVAALGLAFSTSSCATVAGTAVSPLTGAVDAVVMAYDENVWPLTPVIFVGGTIAAPFVAFYNGINYDAANISNNDTYWRGFGRVFRPYEMVYMGEYAR